MPIFIIYLLLFQNYIISFYIFIIASITDWADGYFARKFNVISDFGIFFDPLADKLLVLSAFISFLYIDLLADSIYHWMVIVIAFRDISITLLRIVINSKGNYTLVTSKIAKLKTALQLIAIGFILFCLTFSGLIVFVYPLMLVTTLITLYTGIHYYFNNGKQLIQILFSR